MCQTAYLHGYLAGIETSRAWRAAYILLDLGALRAERSQTFERVNSLSESRQAEGEFALEGSIRSQQAGVWLVRVGQESTNSATLL